MELEIGNRRGKLNGKKKMKECGRRFKKWREKV